MPLGLVLYNHHCARNTDPMSSGAVTEASPWTMARAAPSASLKLSMLLSFYYLCMSHTPSPFFSVGCLLYYNYNILLVIISTFVAARKIERAPYILSCAASSNYRFVSLVIHIFRSTYRSNWSLVEPSLLRSFKKPRISSYRLVC